MKTQRWRRSRPSLEVSARPAAPGPSISLSLEISSVPSLHLGRDFFVELFVQLGLSSFRKKAPSCHQSLVRDTWYDKEISLHQRFVSGFGDILRGHHVLALEGASSHIPAAERLGLDREDTVATEPAVMRARWLQPIGGAA